MFSRALVLSAFAGMAAAFTPSVLPGFHRPALSHSVRAAGARISPLQVRATAAISLQESTPKLAPWRQNLDLAGWASEVSD